MVVLFNNMNGCRYICNTKKPTPPPPPILKKKIK